eukprot:398436-Prymnesium_polylepis.1
MFRKLSLRTRSGFDQASCWGTTSALSAVWTLRMTAAASEIRRAHAERPSRSEVQPYSKWPDTLALALALRGRTEPFPYRLSHSALAHVQPS